MITSDEFVVKTKLRGFNPTVQHPVQSSANNPPTAPSSEPTTDLLASSIHQFIAHHPKAGINPLADAAAYLFSIIGKLKQLQSHQSLEQLQTELIAEINRFQTTVSTKGYSADHVLASRYALCATFDDIISTTSWGGHGQWEAYRLRTAFNNNESASYERFFLILERITKDSSYLDLMEFMYICLSLGFKGHYRDSDSNQQQLEQITDALYKHIRTQQLNFSKTLSPFPLRLTTLTTTPTVQNTVLDIVGITAITVLAIFIGLGYMLNSISNQTYQELINIGKSISYEIPASA